MTSSKRKHQEKLARRTAKRKAADHRRDREAIRRAMAARLALSEVGDKPRRKHVNSSSRRLGENSDWKWVT
jgi:hypothetical protein